MFHILRVMDASFSIPVSSMVFPQSFVALPERPLICGRMRQRPPSNIKCPWRGSVIFTQAVVKFACGITRRTILPHLTIAPRLDLLGITGECTKATYGSLETRRLMRLRLSTWPERGSRHEKLLVLQMPRGLSCTRLPAWDNLLWKGNL